MRLGFSLFPISMLQAMLLAAGQVFMKIAFRYVPPFEWTWKFVWSQVTNWWWLGSGASIVGATILWAYIIKHYPFSLAYPMLSMSYIFGMIASMVIFHEQVSISSWVGIVLILAGCWLIAH